MGEVERGYTGPAGGSGRERGLADGSRSQGRRSTRAVGTSRRGSRARERRRKRRRGRGSGRRETREEKRGGGGDWSPARNSGREPGRQHHRRECNWRTRASERATGLGFGSWSSEQSRDTRGSGLQQLSDRWSEVGDAAEQNGAPGKVLTEAVERIKSRENRSLVDVVDLREQEI